MEYIKTKDGKYIQYQDGRATVLDKAELLKELEFNEAQLSSLPKPPTDKELLILAKEKLVDISATEKSRTLIEAQIAVINEQLEAIKEI